MGCLYLKISCYKKKKKLQEVENCSDFTDLPPIAVEFHSTESDHVAGFSAGH